MATVFRRPIYVPNPYDHSVWGPSSKGSNTLRLLTAVTFFGAGGQAPNKLHRDDYDEGSLWQGKPTPSALLKGLLSQTQAEPARWNFNVDESGPWQAPPNRNPSLLATLVNLVPFVPAKWNFNYDDASGWSFKPQYNLPLVGVFQPAIKAKRWGFDYDDSAAWQGKPTPSALLKGLLGQTQAPPAKWNFTLDEPSNWTAAFQRNFLLLNVVVTPPAIQVPPWRFNYDDASYWSGLPRSSWLLHPALTVGGQVRSRAWLFGYDDAPQPLMTAAFKMNLPLNPPLPPPVGHTFEWLTRARRRGRR